MDHGEATDICERVSLYDVQPLVEVRDRENDADLARTLIHEYAHALLHFDVDDDTERSKREVKDEIEDRPDDLPDDVPTKATVTIKEINNNRYYYWQWRESDTIKSRYKGPVNSDE